MKPVIPNYEVPDVHLISQDKTLACWYASALMLLNWKERNRPSPLAAKFTMIDRETVDLYKANNGIKNHQIIPLAKRLGLVHVPPFSPSVQTLFGWLLSYGPLWTNGTEHVVVIAGIRCDAAGEYELKVYDPEPGVGIEWRSLAGWYTGFDVGFDAISSRDTSSSVEAVFLRVP